jgi:hypothetical protein
MGKHNYTVNAETLTSDLFACKRAFDNVKVPWIITDGIVLGYARNKKVMEWDTDLDFAVFVEINSIQWKAVYDSFFEEGFRMRKHKSDFICGGRLTPINLWFFHKKGNFYESFPRSTPKFKFVEKAIWYDKPEMVDFLGSKFPMPNNINDYLDNHYGKDWKTNIIKDHETWRINKMGEYAVVTDKSLSGRSGKHGDLWPKVIKTDDSIENQ